MSLLTMSGQYLTESRDHPDSPWYHLNSGPTDIRMMYAMKSDSPRRRKPVGLDLLFDGTPYYRDSWVFDDPIVSFGPVQLGGPYGPSYRGYNRVSWFMPTQAVNYLVSPYPTSSEMDYELPERLSSNELRNLIADQKADMLTNILEYKQTSKMFCEASQLLSKQLSEYAKDVQKTIRRYNRVGWGIPGSALTRRLANLHLAYVFGVRPLVADITGAFEVLVESDPRRVFRNRKITGAPKLQQVRDWYGDYGYIINARTVVVRHYTARYKYIVYGEMGPATDWHQYAQLGLNPIATAWELVPWSFAIDRFIQIGDALTSMSALMGLTRSVAYEQLVVDVQSTASHPVGQATFKQRLRARNVRSLDWEPPRFNNTFGANQVVTYTALLRQQLVKLSPMFK